MEEQEQQISAQLESAADSVLPHSPARRAFITRTLGAGALTALLPARGRAATAAMPTRSARADDEPYWDWIADQFPIRPGMTYMNTGTRGPSPRSVEEAQIHAIRASNRDRVRFTRYEYNGEFRTRLREKMAAFLGCNANEVAFTNNTTEGMAFGTMGADMKRGDEIIHTNHDHSSGAQPVHLRCARQGLVPVEVDLSARRYHPASSPEMIVDAIEAAITPRTRLISFCHVNYTDGCLMPVREICEMARARGILTLVDGAHPPGMLKMDLHDLGCDMYAGACHKWMMASMLTGFFYVREEILDRIWPTIYSGPVEGLSMYGEPVSEAGQARASSAAKFEMHGSGSYGAALSIDAALDFHNGITPEAVESRDRYMADRVANALRAMDGVEVFTSEDARLRCGLVAFRLKSLKPSELNRLLWERHQIYIRNVTHEEIGWDANRASLHVMVNGRQVERFIGAVAEIASEHA